MSNRQQFIGLKTAIKESLNPLRQKPQNYISLTDEGDLKNMQKLIDMLEDNDDVQNVWHNWENE